MHQDSGSVSRALSNIPPSLGCCTGAGFPLLPCPFCHILCDLSTPHCAEGAHSVFFKMNYSLCRCRFAVQVGGGGFKLSLQHYLPRSSCKHIILQKSSMRQTSSLSESSLLKPLRNDQCIEPVHLPPLSLIHITVRTTNLKNSQSFY